MPKKSRNTGKDGKSISQELHNTGESFNPSFRNRKIVSNREKYDKEIDQSEDTSEESNFGKLLNQSTQYGQHFQLADEKEWDSQILAQKPGKLFTLDPQLISSALGSIPFYKVIGLDKSKLHPGSVTMYDKKAEENLISHREKYIPEALDTRLDNISLNQDSKIVLLNSQGLPGEILEKDKGNFGCGGKGLEFPVQDVETEEGDREDDLEDWLDSVLGK